MRARGVGGVSGSGRGHHARGAVHPRTSVYLDGPVPLQDLSVPQAQRHCRGVAEREREDRTLGRRRAVKVRGLEGELVRLAVAQQDVEHGVGAGGARAFRELPHGDHVSEMILVREGRQRGALAEAQVLAVERAELGLERGIQPIAVRLTPTMGPARRRGADARVRRRKGRRQARCGEGVEVRRWAGGGWEENARTGLLSPSAA